MEKVFVEHGTRAEIPPGHSLDQRAVLTPGVGRTKDILVAFVFLSCTRVLRVSDLDRCMEQPAWFSTTSSGGQGMKASPSAF